MNTIREIEKINQEELDRGIAGTSASWHAQYEKAPWVYIGNLDHELTEGDVLSVMSQFGEVRLQRYFNVVVCFSQACH
jgi:RNA-binding motif X-linked protein 2